MNKNMQFVFLLLLINGLINIFVQMKKICSDFTYLNIIFTSIAIIVISTYLLNGSFEIPKDNEIDKTTAYMYPFILSLMLVLLYIIIKNIKKYKKLLITVLFYTSITTSLCLLFNQQKSIVITLLFLWLLFDFNTPNKYNDIKMYINNIIAILVSIASIVSINITNFKTGLILLTGLFIFDIFWVFGSKYITNESVMVEVATNIDAPILLKYINNEKEGGLMVLGLGDIIIPALFIKMLFNLNVDKIYYGLSCVSYIAGLYSALYASIVFKQGQPALLYIVPALTIPTIILSLVRNEFNLLMNS